jgi:hypothetical protein
LLELGYKPHSEIVSVAEPESFALNRAGLADMLPIFSMASIAYKLAQVAAGLDDGTRSTVPRKELSARKPYTNPHHLRSESSGRPDLSPCKTKCGNQANFLTKYVTLRIQFPAPCAYLGCDGLNKAPGMKPFLVAEDPLWFRRG